jgi:hypothetical protein
MKLKGGGKENISKKMFKIKGFISFTLKTFDITKKGGKNGKI